MIINLNLGQDIYQTNNGGTLMIDLYQIDNGKFCTKIMPDPNNISLNGLDTSSTIFTFDINDCDNRIPGTNITLHYCPLP